MIAPGRDPYEVFCSDRCKMADLGNWFTESYKVPGRPMRERDSETEAPAIDPASFDPDAFDPDAFLPEDERG